MYRQYTHHKLLMYKVTHKGWVFIDDLKSWDIAIWRLNLFSWQKYRFWLIYFMIWLRKSFKLSERIKNVKKALYIPYSHLWVSYFWGNPTLARKPSFPWNSKIFPTHLHLPWSSHIFLLLAPPHLLSPPLHQPTSSTFPNYTFLHPTTPLIPHPTSPTYIIYFP